MSPPLFATLLINDEIPLFRWNRAALWYWLKLSLLLIHYISYSVEIKYMISRTYITKDNSFSQDKVSSCKFYTLESKVIMNSIKPHSSKDLSIINSDIIRPKVDSSIIIGWNIVNYSSNSRFFITKISHNLE